MLLEDVNNRIGRTADMLAVEPELAGSTVMFMAADVGYVLGSALMFAAALLPWRIRGRGSAVWQLLGLSSSSASSTPSTSCWPWAPRASHWGWPW